MHTFFSAAGLAVLALSFSSTAFAEPLDDVLKQKISLAIERDSLELSLQALAAKVRAEQPEFQIKILGKDLQFEGITRNQSIRNLALEDKSIADILTAIVSKANPVTTVKDLSDADQKLVWLVGPDPDEPKRQAILITTRSAAKKRGDKLPAVFQKAE